MIESSQLVSFKEHARFECLYNRLWICVKFNKVLKCDVPYNYYTMTCQKVRISLAVPPSYLPTKYVDSLSDQIASLPGTSQKATMGSTEKNNSLTNQK